MTLPLNLHWTVGHKVFYNKRDALIYASQQKLNLDNIRLSYFHNVWENFDRSKLGKTNLDELYKQRAQQLRDTYDYLILYYSGGADSHNVLMTFINNDIPLDEVCVKWPKVLTDNKFYTPNCIDKSARNFWSEWDFSVKPSLKWLSTNYPKIKITIKDYVESHEKIDIASLFDKLNFVRPGGMLLNSVTSDTEKYLKFKKIAHIYGIDKPQIGFHKNKFYMFFSDVAFDQAGQSDITPTGVECFYWTPLMPIIAFEQAYQLIQYLKINYDLLDTHMRFPDMPVIRNITAFQLQNDLAKQILYTTWDNRFQANKPIFGNRKDKFFWFYESPEFANLRKLHEFEIRQRIDEISDTFLVGSNLKNVIPVYATTRSKGYYVDSL
jgi:hypothetical protein